MTPEQLQVKIERYKAEILLLKSNIELLEKPILKMQSPYLPQPQCSCKDIPLWGLINITN